MRDNLDAANADDSSKDGCIDKLCSFHAEALAEKEEHVRRLAQAPPNALCDDAQPLQPQLASVVEDSQPNENSVVVSRDLFRDPFMGHNSAGSQQSPIRDNDLLGLFPTTPVAQKPVMNSKANIPSSQTNVASPQIGDPRKQQRMPISRQAPPKSRPQTSGDVDQNSDGLSTSIQRPPVSMPRSILKDPRAEKRPAAAASIVSTSLVVSKRRKSTLAGLGPVIADSQSPDRLLYGKGRKQSTKAKRTLKGETEVRGLRTLLKRFSR